MGIIAIILGVVTGIVVFVALWQVDVWIEKFIDWLCNDDED
jgi:hypothetical protein